MTVKEAAKLVKFIALRCDDVGNINGEVYLDDEDVEAINVIVEFAYAVMEAIESNGY